MDPEIEKSGQRRHRLKHSAGNQIVINLSVRPTHIPLRQVSIDALMSDWY